MTLPEDVSHKARAYLNAHKKHQEAEEILTAAHLAYRDTYGRLNEAAEALYAAKGLSENSLHFVDAGLRTATYIQLDGKLLRLNYEYTTSAGIKVLEVQA